MPYQKERPPGWYSTATFYGLSKFEKKIWCEHARAMVPMVTRHNRKVIPPQLRRTLINYLNERESDGNFDSQREWIPRSGPKAKGKRRRNEEGQGWPKGKRPRTGDRESYREPDLDEGGRHWGAASSSGYHKGGSSWGQDSGWAENVADQACANARFLNSFLAMGSMGSRLWLD